MKHIPEMTDQEINMALAEFMGWELINTDGAPTSDCIPEYIDPATEEHQIFYDEWHPHDDLNQVWRCVEKMAENGWFIDFFDDANSLCAKFTNIDTGKSSVCAYGSRPTRIICEAILMTVEHG